LAILYPLHFHMNFRISLLIFTNFYSVWILTEIVFDL
jgi:hypothetical protein